MLHFINAKPSSSGDIVHYSRKTVSLFRKCRRQAMQMCLKNASHLRDMYICIFAAERFTQFAYITVGELSNMSQFKVYAFYSIYASRTNSCRICSRIKPIVEEQQLSRIANLLRDNAVGKCLEIILMLDYYYSSFPGD